MESTDAEPRRSPTTWQIYKQRFLPTQAFIVICCALMLFAVKMHWASVLAAFLFVQLAAVWGAFSGKRLLEKIEGQGARGEGRD